MTYPYNPEKRAATVAAFIDWVRRYPGPAEELFNSSENYHSEIEIMEYNLSECRREMSLADIEWSEWMVEAEQARQRISREIEQRFAVRKQAAE